MSKSNMNLKLVAGLLVASSSTAAMASMNNLNVQSHLGERFNGSIVVTGPTAQEILKSPSSVKISGAPVSARVSKQGDSAVIHLRSKTPINDPVMRLSIQAGTQSRHYSAIIDPKDSAHQSAQVNANKAIPAVPTTAANNAQVTMPPKPNTTESNSSSQNTPQATSTKVDEAAVTVKAKKPAAEMPRVNKRTIQNNRQHAQPVKTPTIRSARVAAAEQYKVQPNDNIHAIASRFQPQGLSTAQTVNALLRANPQAFRNKNPNLLYGDATLNIPSAQDMHLLATGRMPKAAIASSTNKIAATAAVATVASASVAAQAANASGDDVQAIKKQLAELETQKKQLEQKLAQELAEAEAAKKAAIEAEKKAAAEAQAAADKKAADTANIDKQAAADAEKKAAADIAQAASAPIPMPASAPQVAASEATASAVVASAVATEPVIKPKPKKPLPEPEPEPELLDLIMQYLPYLAGGLITLLLVFFLLKKRQQKSNNDPDGGDDHHDDGDIQFDLDEASTDKKDTQGNDSNNLSSAELDALNAFDSFDADSDETLHQATAQPTIAPKVIAGSTVIGAAAVGATYATNSFDNDFMPSAEDLAQFAHPDATVAPELDDFNLDDLDQVFKPHPSSSAPTAAPTQTHQNDDLGGFDLNELDSLLQQNGFGDQTPAPIQNFTNQQHADTNLNFDLDDVLKNTNSFAQPSAALNFDKSTNQTSHHSNASFDDFNDDFNLDTLNDLGDLPKTAMAQPAPTIKPTTAPAADEFDLGDFDLSSFESLNDTPQIAVAHAAPTSKPTAAPVADEFDLDNFDLSSFEKSNDVPQITTEQSAPTTRPTAAPVADEFDLGDFDLSSFEKSNDAPQHTTEQSAPTTRPTAAPAADEFDLGDFDLSSFENLNNTPQIAAAQSAPTNQPTSAPALDDFDLSNFDVSSLDSLSEIAQTAAPIAKIPSLNDLDFEDDFQAAASAKPSLSKTSDINFDSTTAANAGLTLSQEDINDINFDFNLDTIATETPSAKIPVAAAALAVTTAVVAEAEPVANLSFDELDLPEEITATNMPKVEAGSDSAIDDHFALNLDELFSESDNQVEDHTSNDASIANTEDDDFVSKFSSISLESEHNQLAFDDSFSGLNFDDLLKTDDTFDTLLGAEETEAAPTTSDFPELATKVEQAASPEFSVHDFKDFSIDTPPAKSDRPTQAWAGTGDFGLPTEEHAEQPINALPEAEDAFDFGSLSLDDENAIADIPTIQAADPISDAAALDLDALLQTDANDLAAPDNTIELPVHDSILSLDVDTSESTSLTEHEASDLDFDLSLDGLNLDELNPAIEPSSQPAPTATPDIVSHQFDFPSNDEINTPKETVATPEPEISESLSIEDFDLSFSVPANAQAVSSMGLTLDNLNLDDNANANTTSQDEFNLDDFELTLDVDAVDMMDTTAASSNTFSLDDFALSLETETTAATTSDTDIALALEELESFDLSELINTQNNANQQASEDISLDDFDLSFDLDMPSDTSLQDASHITETLNGTNTATSSSLDSLGLDLDLDSAFNSELFQEAPDLALIEPSVTPTTSPSIPAPLAMIETAPPIVDKDAYLNNMEHTYSAKWELAQMYSDLGESDAAREILIDLIESGSETYSKRAQNLFNSL
ncbi:FimV/HubP family polar landmark protein [Vitreoscilla stercoraria]|uniref:LysM domain-containing protein n=1 Tax=Vitreoscilla stercoraria TaxID=61 RepID=A0ABY4EEZ9_VITST|nr:FimV/HubP family polar landmark protein [Vitreoscilla stercoraria]UOO91992.1 hypothetical protein LVJ81_10170 [Vitreoscilla stercoraria]